MVNLNSNQQSSIPFTPVNSNSAGTINSPRSSQALTDEISQMFSQILQQLGIDPSSIKLASAPGASQASVPDPSTVTASTPTARAASQSGFNALVQANIVASAAAGATPISSGSPHWYAPNAVDDAYWNAQPAAVRQLREIDDMSQRQALAGELSSKGYQIDNAIMVWGWDAGQVTAERQAFGYTWVPAATQANVTAAPGLTGAGMTPYDPNNPPAGSIIVPSVAS